MEFGNGQELGCEWELRKWSCDVAILIGDAGMCLEPLSAVALCGWVKCEVAQPLFGVEQCVGNGWMWDFSGFGGWDVERYESGFVREDELLPEETGDSLFELRVCQEW